MIKMPNIQSGGRTKRLEQDLKDMTILARRCPAIKFRTLDSGNAPQKYEVSFYLRTIIGEKRGKPVYREANNPTRVIIDLSNYPFGRIRSNCVTMPQPYHPNWFEGGSWCQITGDSRVSDTLAELVIRMAKTIQFVPAVTNPGSAANGSAASWWRANVGRSGYFPCDTTAIPEAFQLKSVITIHRN